jgi:hypothetical protein
MVKTLDQCYVVIFTLDSEFCSCLVIFSFGAVYYAAVVLYLF